MSFLKRAFAVLIALTMLCTCSCRKNKDAGRVVIPGTTAVPDTSDSSGTALDSSGALKLSIPENADRTSPYSINTEEMQTMYSLIFESLLNTDSSGKLIPELAQSWARSEKGDNVWLLNLRTNIKWHDGTDFTANDVVFSYNTLKSYLSSDGAASYYADMLNKIESIKKFDDNTVEVKAATMGYSSLYGLCFPIVCESTWQSSPLNGTGAYRVTENKSTSMTLTVNEGWWKELPHIKTITFDEKLNNETALASYEAGQLNFVATSSLSAGKYRREDVTNVMDIMTQGSELLIFNYKNSLLYDMNIRKAIAYSIDRNKVITNIYMNRAQACDVPLPPDSWLYSTKSKVIEYNPEYACTLLENAGYTDSDGDGIREKDGNQALKLSFTLLVSENTDNTIRKNAAEMIAEQLLDCGIGIQIRSETFSLSDPESQYMKSLKSGDFDLALTGVSIPQNGDLTEFFAANGSLNFGGISDETLYALAANTVTAKDETAMRDCAYELQTAFTEKLPFIVLYFRLNSIVYTSSLQGLSDVREPNIMRSIDRWYIGK